MSSEAEPVLRRSKREHQPSAKATATATAVSASSSSRRSQRRRVAHSASPASTPASTRNSSPVRGSVPSPASSDLVSVVVDAVGPNGQRRRVRAAAHTSVSQGVHSTYPGGVQNNKVLGRYSSRDCAVLCEVILHQLKKQTLAPTVLAEVKSPAFIRWEPVAKKMETTHKMRVTPRECQVLWKFLAYGEIPVETDALLPDSDEEDFHKTPKEINAQVAAKAQEKEKDKSQATEETSEVKSEQVSTEAKSSENDDKGETDTGTVQNTQDGDTQMESESVRLYPTYSLPTGAPDAWYRPFGPKDAMPLTFVASRFLRRKPTPPMQSLAGKSTLAPATVDLKRQAVPAMNIAAKKPKVATPPILTPPRVFTPSSTPPPAATRARSELEFFEQRLREDQARKAPGVKFELSAGDIQRRYGETSAQVRHECQMLATHDVERFNREVVRVRIWEKAMGTSNTTPTSTPLPAASIPKPATSPSTSTCSTTKPISATPTDTVAARSSDGPVIKKSSGPTAALLAHAAAVAATAEKHRNSVGNTSATTTASQQQKDGEATNVKPRC